jgi:hypothetical protein
MSNEDTLIADEPIFEAGHVASPSDSMKIIAAGGDALKKHMQLTGADKFEHMLLYTLKLLEQAKGEICAFYLSDFDDCDETTMKVIQKLIKRSGYTVNDYVEKSDKGPVYKGFWAWLKKDDGKKKK